MKGMKELANLVRELEEQLVVCNRCGMCQAVCPVYEQTRREADVARGKLSLLTGLMEDMFSDPDGVDERLNRCLLCGSCAANCPSGVNVMEIFIKARAILTEFKGLSAAEKIIFKQVLTNPGRFDRIMEWASRFQGLFTRSEANAQCTSCARLTSRILSGRHFKPLSAAPFHKTLPEQGLKTKGSGLKAAFFTGCLIDKIFPGVAQACLKVLSHHKVSVIIPQDQGCCGIPALASGDRDTFNHLVEHNLALFEREECDVIVTACATCTSTIKKLWPAVYRNPSSKMQKRLASLSEKTMDINQFLVDQVGIDLLYNPAEDTTSEIVTWHDPCHLKKSLGVADQPRQVITAAGYRLKEMAESDKCCGMGGSFNVHHYDLSCRIGKQKQKNIENTGCDIVSTGCPACMMQISDMLGKAGSSVKIVHPMELYAQALGKNA